MSGRKCKSRKKRGRKEETEVVECRENSSCLLLAAFKIELWPWELCCVICCTGIRLRINALQTVPKWTSRREFQS